jgi:hypothetical protein
METKIRNGNLIVVLPLEQPKLSATGKALVVASSRDVRKTTFRLDGQILCVIANAFVYPDESDDGSAPRKKRNQRVSRKDFSHPGLVGNRHKTLEVSRGTRE